MARALAYPDDRRKTARLARLSRGLRGLLIPQAVENLRAGEEDRARAGEQQQLAAIAWIFVKISRTARHRADGEGINDQARFQARLDDEQADRKSVVSGKSGLVRGDPGGRRILKNNTKNKELHVNINK